jgi:hypothetical protein
METMPYFSWTGDVGFQSLLVKNSATSISLKAGMEVKRRNRKIPRRMMTAKNPFVKKKALMADSLNLARVRVFLIGVFLFKLSQVHLISYKKNSRAGYDRAILPSFLLR